MTTVRMNESHRTFLYNLAREQVKCVVEEKADKVAYENAAPLVRKIVEDRYPPKDMKLLLKYEVAGHDDCIRLQLAAGGVVQFNFRTEKSGPLTPGRRGYSCQNRMYAADESATVIISTSLQAHEAIRKAYEKKLEDYKALIWNTPTLEQIESVWPAAKALRDRVERTLPVTLSADVIARIKADIRHEAVSP